MPALIGLAGVLVGALVTAGVTYLGDRNHRIEENRTARRLVANEIHTDVHNLMYVWLHGAVGKGHQTRTAEWLGEGPTLARYVDESEWSTLSVFYDNLEFVEPSLPAHGCVRPNTWRLAFTTAKYGDAALTALGTRPVPLGAASPAPELGKNTSNGCRAGPLSP
jgi:hypothetical protein